MIFGPNILSRTPAKWTLSASTMTTTDLSIQAGGYATQSFSAADLAEVPESFYISLIANGYSDTSDPKAFAVINVQSNMDTYYEYIVPIINTGNGYCTATIKAVQTSFKAASFTIRSETPITLTEWVLSVPLGENQAAIDSIRLELPGILDDYNKSIFNIGQEEVTIGFITMDLLKNADMNGHLLISYYSTISAQMTIRIKDNGISELYTPIISDVIPGRHTIGIPHAYLKKRLGIRTFSVTAQVDRGTISILTRGLLYTIDGAHMAQRLLDINVPITDMTIRQLPSEPTPTRVYAVGIEDDMARVRFRPIAGGVSVIWEPLYEVGPAKYAAIEFNGVWAERLGSPGFTLLTEELPWVIWLGLDNVLYAQRGTDINTMQTLATGVSTVSAIRGFKSNNIPESDQGIVVVYIKGGKVYYRSYATQANNVTLWEIEVEIVAAGSNNTWAHISRLNDYRLALATTGASGNMLFITERTYADQAFRSDHSVLTDATVSNPVLTPIAYHDLVSPDEHVVHTDAAVMFQYGESVGDFSLPRLGYFDSFDDNKLLALSFDSGFYGIHNIDPATITVSPPNTIVNIELLSFRRPLAELTAELTQAREELVNNSLLLEFAQPVDIAKPIILQFGSRLNAGYNKDGPKWFDKTVWTIPLDYSPPGTSEHVQLSDANVELTWVDTQFPERYMAEHVALADASVGPITLTATGGSPI